MPVISASEAQSMLALVAVQFLGIEVGSTSVAFATWLGAESDQRVSF